MAATCRFEPEARTEYLAALRHYALEIKSVEIARRFAVAIESALAAICATPELWRIAEPPAIRRYVLRRFPFVLYYLYEPAENRVTVYAVMHTSRRPGYWRGDS